MTQIDGMRAVTARRMELAAMWFVRLSDAPLAADDQAALEEWLGEDDANGEALDSIAALWTDMDERADAPEILTLRAGALHWLRRANRRRWSIGRPMRWRWIAMSGAVAAALVLAVSIPSVFFQRDQVIATQVGERRVVTLNDGSRVSLDGNSSISYRFDGSRRILALLAGRAKFDVAKDRSRPFTVTAGERTVIATGTSFSVEMLQRQVHVILYEGHVAVVDTATLSHEGPNAHLLSAIAPRQMLAPGKELIATAGQPQPRVTKADLDESLAWESGLMDFRDEPLNFASERMNRYAARRIVIDDGPVGQLPINGVFHAGDVDAFVSSIVALYPVTATRSADAIHLHGKAQSNM